ncbi:hypothetical protein EDB81DRAFT_899233 [Dactylonectria macrodidyma]|uniref:Uncharacterized protein n=1 Tax=Dactylonectria macrodidyma TaxID=307937 RepID=A0A9P9EQQ9_9HYPO|nr:hypothetical protein EDB81DRAFT_899233 [Dactylonectria macrodidyma]
MIGIPIPEVISGFIKNRENMGVTDDILTLTVSHRVSLGAVTAIFLLPLEPLIQAILIFEDQQATANGTQHTYTSDTSDSQASSPAPIIARSSLLDVGYWTGHQGSALSGSLNLRGRLGKVEPQLLNEHRPYPARYRHSSGYLERFLASCDAADPLAHVCMGDRELFVGQFSLSCRVLQLLRSVSDVKKTSEIITVSHIPLPGEGDHSEPPDISNDAVDANVMVSSQRLAVTKYEISGLGLTLSNYNGKSRCVSGADMFPDTYLSARNTTNPGHTISFGGLNTMVLAIQFLQVDESQYQNKTKWEDTAITAYECGLFFSINEYQIVLRDDIFYVKTVSSWNNKTPASYLSENLIMQQYFEFTYHTLCMEGAWFPSADP